MTALPGRFEAMSTSTTVTAAVLLTIPVALLGACSTNKPAANKTTSSSSAAAPGTEKITSQLRTADGKPVANATLDFANGYATVTVETVAGGILTPGFHGLHIHSVGKCDANSVAPTGGEPADFASAGGHFEAPGQTSHPHSGDLTSLEVRPDGSAKLVTTTAAFTAADLRGGQGTALVIHADPDNFGNIPTRYDSGGPDKETLATGDSGKRVACGVISPPTGATPSTETSTVTETVGPTHTDTHTTTTTTTSSSTSTSTSTSTATTTAPAGPPPGPGG
jgi:Cu-Zn family superoxide dismutase